MDFFKFPEKKKSDFIWQNQSHSFFFPPSLRLAWSTRKHAFMGPWSRKDLENDFLCVSIWAGVGHVLMPNSILWRARSHGSCPRGTHLQASRQCWGRQIGGPAHWCFIFGLSDRSHSLKVVRAGDLFEPVLSRVTSKVGIFSMYASGDCLLSLLWKEHTVGSILFTYLWESQGWKSS